MADIDGTPRERLDDAFTTPYPNEEEDAVWDALLASLAPEFAAIDTTRADIEDAKFVGTATGDRLNKLASIFQKTRGADEPIEEFRARLKVGLQQQISTATPPEVHQVAAVILDVPIDAITVVESKEEPFFQIAVDRELAGQLPISPEVMSEVMANVSAVGVFVGTNVFIGADGVMVLTGGPSSHSTKNDEGLSASGLGKLSSGTWRLSHVSEATL